VAHFSAQHKDADALQQALSVLQGVMLVKNASTGVSSE